MTDEPHYYLVLEENMEFPSWFTYHKKGVLKVPISKMVDGLHIFNFISEKTKKGKLVGKDQKLKYYLDKVIFTGNSIDGKFFLRLFFTYEMRETFTEKYKVGSVFIFDFKNKAPIYEIYPPVFQ